MNNVNNKSRLIYSGESLEAFYHQGNSDYLLITFNPFGVAANGRDYWGKSLVEKNGINCISLITRRSNWFPSSDVLPLVSDIRAILQYFRGKIILYGTSMGAYAAIKYSKVFNANSVLAFSPQYSISPVDVGSFEKRFCSWYSEEKNGDMKIANSDVEGEIFIFYDPKQYDDAAHVNAIANAAKNICRIKTPFTGHYPIEVFAGSERAIKLFASSLSNKSHSISKLTNNLRRTSAVRVRTLARSLGYKNPGRALAIYTKHVDKFDARSLMLLSDAIRVRDSFSAVRLAQAAIDLDSKDARSYYYLALALEASGNNLGAKDAITEAMRLDVNNLTYSKFANQISS